MRSSRAPRTRSSSSRSRPRGTTLKAANIQLLTPRTRTTPRRPRRPSARPASQLLNAQNGYATAEAEPPRPPGPGGARRADGPRGRRRHRGQHHEGRRRAERGSGHDRRRDLPGHRGRRRERHLVDQGRPGRGRDRRLDRRRPRPARSPRSPRRRHRPRSSSSVVSYAVTIDVASPPKTLRSGMTSNITITTASAPQRPVGPGGRDPRDRTATTPCSSSSTARPRRSPSRSG